MKKTRHIIRRQTLEVQGVQEEDAHQVQAALNELFNKKILPLIDKYLTTFSPGETRQQLDKLTLDLGNIPRDQLEKNLLEKVEEQLNIHLPPTKEQLNKEAALADGLAQQDEKTKRPEQEAAAQLALFQHFIATGNLPWWVEDMQGNDPLSESLDYLLTNAPHTLESAMRRWTKKPAALQRIIRQLNGTKWTSHATLEIAERLNEHFQAKQEQAEKQTKKSKRPAQEAAAQLALFQHFIKTGRLPHWAVEENGANLLLESLNYLLEHSPQALETAIHDWAGKETALKRLIQQLKYPEWIRLAALNMDILPSKLNAMLMSLEDLLLQENASTGKMREELAIKLFSWIYLSATIVKNTATFWKGFFTQLAANSPRSYPELLSDCYHEIKKREPTASNIDTSLAAFITKLYEEKLTNKEALSKTEMADKASKTNNFDETKSKQAAAFSASDEIYIYNAGLVILWPFLERFFENSGLIAKKQFVNEASRHRAIGLLQYLADGQAQAAEYRCTLNKILCALSTNTVLDFGEDITEEEAVECEKLLQAVIANAPILGEMSIDGFRGSFLLRKGILKKGTWGWQLYMEPATYDVVLEKFPWNWKIIKLPWMEKGIEVN